jgi:hypothetical protein
VTDGLYEHQFRAVSAPTNGEMSLSEITKNHKQTCSDTLKVRETIPNKISQKQKKSIAINELEEYCVFENKHITGLGNLRSIR